MSRSPVRLALCSMLLAGSLAGCMADTPLTPTGYRLWTVVTRGAQDEEPGFNSVEVILLRDGVFEIGRGSADFPSDADSVLVPVTFSPTFGAEELTVRVRLLDGDEAVFQTDVRVSVERGGVVTAPAVVARIWVEAVHTGGPGPHEMAAVAYAPARGVYLAGGRGDDGDLATLWLWSDVGWQLAGQLPAAIHGASLAYDFDTQRLWLFGGQSGDASPADGTMYRFTGTGWDATAPTGGPAPRSHHAMAYDYQTQRRRVLLFGGLGANGVLGDTWDWNGTQWNNRATTGPAPRYGHTLVMNGNRARPMLFGGTDGTHDFADVWEWDGNAWTEITTSGSIPARHAHAGAWDDVLRQFIVFGGMRGDSLADDLWALADSIWISGSSVRRPSARAWAGGQLFGLLRVLGDPDGPRGIVLFGGMGRTGRLDDVWRYR